MSADCPIEQAPDVAERVVRLVRRAAADDRADRAGDLFRMDVGNRPRSLPLDEFLLDDAVGFLALFQGRGVSLEEFLRDRTEGVLLLALGRGPLARPISSSHRRAFCRASSSEMAPHSPMSRRIGFFGLVG
jgi:hypothetical protein